ncbi:MAG: DUF1801 domain-containing protein [Pedobacter sp.]|nr:MAG: DUF1801 domain-containing protein [Pedobacter sp.]
MNSELDNFYLKQEPSIRDCLLALKTIILNYDEQISAEFKYKLPFFYYNGKPLCYFWKHKIYKQPYIGFVDGILMEHPSLLREKRARMKILLINQEMDIQIDIIHSLLAQAINFQITKPKKLNASDRLELG